MACLTNIDKVHRESGRPLTLLRFVYTLAIWSSLGLVTKRISNIKTNGLDFIDGQGVFEGMTYTFEDDRFAYRKTTLCHAGLVYRNF